MEELTEEEVRAEEAKAVWEGVEPEHPPVEDVEEEEDTEETAEEEQEEAPADPWADVPEAVKNTLQGINSKLQGLDRMDMRLKQAESRLGSMANEFYNAKKAADKVDDAPTKKEMAAAAENQESWDALKEDFPEWADALEAGIKTKTADMDKTITELRGQIQQLSHQPNNEPEIQELKRQIAIMPLATKHPDWEQVKDSAPFQAWLAAQPQNIQHDALANPDPMAAAKVLDLFKKNKPKSDVSKNRKARLEQSQEVRGKAPPKSAAEADMTEAEYRKRLKKELWKD